MSSAYHDEALRKTRCLERRSEASPPQSEYLTVQVDTVPVVKSIPEAEYLKHIEAENKQKCKKR